MSIKKLFPWWSRIFIKIILAKMPIPYDFWKKIGVFRHGEMDDPKLGVGKALSNYKHALTYTELKKDFITLELGPGDSLISALVFKALGAKKTYLIDAGNFATQDIEIYKKASKYLIQEGYNAPDLEKIESMEDYLRECNAVYLTEGLKSIKGIDKEEVDLHWSSVVLEHVPKYEFEPMIKELRRVSSLGSIGLHGVDIKDHMGGSLNNLRFSEKFWEKDLIKESGLYTNRIRFSEMVQIFEQSEFQTEVKDIIKWENPPFQKKSFHKDFQQFSDEDLSVSEFHVVLR